LKPAWAKVVKGKFKALSLKPSTAKKKKKKVQIPLSSVLNKQLPGLYKWQIMKPLKSDFFSI
jgi:hypothetical protein